MAERATEDQIHLVNTDPQKTSLTVLPDMTPEERAAAKQQSALERGDVRAEEFVRQQERAAGETTESAAREAVQNKATPLPDFEISNVNTIPNSMAPVAASEMRAADHAQWDALQSTLKAHDQKIGERLNPADAKDKISFATYQRDYRRKREKLYKDYIDTNLFTRTTETKKHLGVDTANAIQLSLQTHPDLLSHAGADKEFRKLLIKDVEGRLDRAVSDNPLDAMKQKLKAVNTIYTTAVKTSAEQGGVSEQWKVRALREARRKYALEIIKHDKEAAATLAEGVTPEAKYLHQVLSEKGLDEKLAKAGKPRSRRQKTAPVEPPTAAVSVDTTAPAEERTEPAMTAHVTTEDLARYTPEEIEQGKPMIDSLREAQSLPEDEEERKQGVLRTVAGNIHNIVGKAEGGVRKRAGRLALVALIGIGGVAEYEGSTQQYDQTTEVAGHTIVVDAPSQEPSSVYTVAEPTQTPTPTPVSTEEPAAVAPVSAPATETGEPTATATNTEGAAEPSPTATPATQEPEQTGIPAGPVMVSATPTSGPAITTPTQQPGAEQTAAPTEASGQANEGDGTGIESVATAPAETETPEVEPWVSQHIGQGETIGQYLKVKFPDFWNDPDVLTAVYLKNYDEISKEYQTVTGNTAPTKEQMFAWDQQAKKQLAVLDEKVANGELEKGSDAYNAQVDRIMDFGREADHWIHEESTVELPGTEAQVQQELKAEQQSEQHAGQSSVAEAQPAKRSFMDKLFRRARG